MSGNINFALNHMLAPQMTLDAFFGMAASMGINAVEIRNDIAGNPFEQNTPAEDVKALAEKHSVEIISINALQRFNEWSDVRLAEANEFIGFAERCGSKALVMCPVNDHDYGKSDDELAANLRQSLTELKPLLETAGITGLVEPLGFPQCSLRRKADAVAAIRDVNGEGVFKLVHDTFHHHLAEETEFFADQTGLMHISGVEDPDLSIAQMLDDHRLLVGESDRLGNAAQIKTMLANGYTGHVSLEPFSPVVHALENVVDATQASFDFLKKELQAANAA